MRIFDGTKYRDMTEEEIIVMQTDNEASQAEYWNNTDYGEAINSEIRKKYTQSQEFAILRQKDEKTEEYIAYYEYCEQCKVYVKEQKKKYEGVV